MPFIRTDLYFDPCRRYSYLVASELAVVLDWSSGAVKRYAVPRKQLPELHDRFADRFRPLLEDQRLWYLHSGGKVRRLYVDITNKCNFACEYCYVNQDEPDADMRTLKARIAEFIDRAPPEQFEIRMFGGEPLLRFGRIVSLREWAEQNYPDTKFRFYISTNGSLLTRSILDYCQKHEFKLKISYEPNGKLRTPKAGISSASIDGVLDETRIGDYRDMIWVGLTTTGRTFNLADTIRSLHERFCLNNFSWQFAISAKAQIDGTLLMGQIHEVAGLSRKLPILNIDNFARIARCLRYGRLMGCMSGFSSVHIGSGGVSLCQRLKDIAGCGVSPESDTLQRELIRSTPPECVSCWNAFVCYGGCYQKNLLLGGSLTRVPESICALSKATTVEALALMAGAPPDAALITGGASYAS